MADHFIFFEVAATTEIYTLSLHDALPILLLTSSRRRDPARDLEAVETLVGRGVDALVLAPSDDRRDRKSTRLNSSHPSISYAVFCLKKKNDKSSTSASSGRSSWRIRSTAR